MEKQKKIPSLRFPDFSEEWSLKKMGALTNRISNPVDVEDDELYSQIGIRSHGKGIFYKEAVTGKSLGNKRVFWIKENTFIVNIVFAWEQAVSKTTEKEIGMIASHRFPMYLPIENQSNLDYLLYFFLTPKGKSLLELASPGGAGRNKTLGQKEFENLKFLIPNVVEQTKIASFLTVVNDKLTQLKKKKTLLEQYKKGVMQKIFKKSELGFIGLKDEKIIGENGLDNNKVSESELIKLKEYRINEEEDIDNLKVADSGGREYRDERIIDEDKKEIQQSSNPKYHNSDILKFKDDNGKVFPEWKEKNLGEFARITTGSSNREDSNLDGEFTFFDRSQDIRSSNRFLFDAEAIIVPGEGQEFIPKYFIGKFDLHQRTYAIMDFDGQNGKFLYYSISYNSNHLISHAVGSTVKSLRLPMFEKMPILLPCLAEQAKIANFLFSIDEKINHTQTQIEKTETWKKGLLQQMFF